MGSSFFYVFIFLFFTTFSPAFVCSVLAQNSSISGFVSSSDGSVLIDINVELMDDLNRTIARTRTDSSGRYNFGGVATGTYRVKVLSSGTNFREQVQQIEITSFTGSGSDAQRVQLNFVMKPRQEKTVGLPSVLYVQDVPETARKLFEAGVSAIQKKNIDEGIGLLNESLKVFPNYVMALSKLGYEYVKLQNYDLAIEKLKKALLINQQDFTNWQTLGFCYVSIKNLPEALEAIEKAISINSESIEALLLYGIALRQYGKFEEAEKQMLKAKKLSKNKYPDVHWNLALLYAHNLKKYSLAADELELYLKAQTEFKDLESIKKLIQQYRQKGS